MATKRDWAHMRAIAEGEAVLNLESIRRAALRTPGENVEAGLALSEFAAALAIGFGNKISNEPKPSIPALWKSRRRRGRGK
jgi:hypothetical protein